MEWMRWYNGTVSDPKWRAIARRTDAPVATIVAVWATVCENANQSPVRGTLDNWVAEDVAAALDLDTEQVERILDAMQGKVLDGDELTGWAKRNPASDDSKARVRRHRERKRKEAETRDVTLRNVTEGYVTPQEVEEEEERDTDTTSSVLKLRVRDEIEDQADGIIRLANRGMNDNPEIADACRPITPGHGSRQIVLDWLSDGIDPTTAGRVVYDRAKAYQPGDRRRQITTMRYFNGAVRDEHDRRTAQITEIPPDEQPDTGRPGGEAARRAAAGGDRGPIRGKYDHLTIDGRTGVRGG